MHGYLLEDDDLRFVSLNNGLFVAGFANNSDLMTEFELCEDVNSEQTKQIGTYLNIDTRNCMVR